MSKDKDTTEWITRLFKRYRDALDAICELCMDCGEEGCACVIALRALEDRDELEGEEDE